MISGMIIFYKSFIKGTIHVAMYTHTHTYTLLHCWPRNTLLESSNKAPVIYKFSDISLLLFF